MASIAITQSADYWSLHTEALIEQAAREIYTDESLGTQRTNVVRSWALSGYPDIHLEVQEANTGELVCPLGTTVVHTAAGWECITDDVAIARGIPVPTTEQP